MQTAKIDLDAPILPDQGLAGLVVRSHLIKYEELFKDRELLMSYELVTPFEARYRWMRGEVAASFDVRNSKLAKLVAGQGYRGALFDRITVGMSVEDALSLEPRLYYDEGEEVILCRDCDGVAIDPGEIDPPPEIVPTLTIHSIVVYPRELFTLNGIRGVW